MSERWTINELSLLAEKALNSADYDGQASGRVREVPDARTIRYYTTLGLIDPPAEMRGRKAFYSRRHVLQLAAIKRLQACGHSLPQVQQALLGADARALAKWAGLSNQFWNTVAAEGGGKDQPAPDKLAVGTAARARFWTQPIAASTVEPAPASAVRRATLIPVCAGVELVIDGTAGEIDAAVLAGLTPLLTQIAKVLGESACAETIPNQPRQALRPTLLPIPGQRERIEGG